MKDKFKQTVDGLPFLEYAAPTEVDENQVIMVYLSPAGKHLLNTYQSWSGDGTFETAPDMFFQVRAISLLLIDFLKGRIKAKPDVCINTGGGGVLTGYFFSRTNKDLSIQYQAQ